MSNLFKNIYIIFIHIRKQLHLLENKNELFTTLTIDLYIIYQIYNIKYLLEKKQWSSISQKNTFKNKSETKTFFGKNLKLAPILKITIFKNQPIQN